MGGKTGVKLVEEFHRISDKTRKSETGKEYHQVRSSSKLKGREYKVKADTVGRFRDNQIISESVYNSVKEEYDIRMKCWDGDTQHLGQGVFYISGRKRALIRDFLDKRKYPVKEEKHHYIVTGNGKNVAWMAMRSDVQEMKTVTFLYIQVIGESGYDIAARELKLP